MEQEGVNVQSLIDTDQPPAPGAEEPKPTDAPAHAADVEKAEEAAETPEQVEARRESRRARSNARKAAELAEARTEARMLREQLERSQQQSKPESGEPKRDQFQDYESYLRAVTRYEAEQVTEAKLKREREASRGREAQAGQEKLAAQWTEREKAFQATTKDYEEVVKSYVDTDITRLSGEARRYIVESDEGPRLLYQLANSDDHDRIAGLSPVKQVAELVKLESKFPQPKKASDAPPPVKPVGQGRSAPNGYNDNMSDAEYKAWRKGHGARWAH